MASNTLSVYIPSPLFDRVKQAEQEGKFKIKEVCVEALEKALNPPQLVAPNGSVMPLSETQAEHIDLASTEGANELAEQASQLEYQASYSNTIQELQAFLDHIASQGAWPISVTCDQAGRFLTIVAWPKVLSEVPG